MFHFHLNFKLGNNIDGTELLFSLITIILTSEAMVPEEPSGTLYLTV